MAIVASNTATPAITGKRFRRGSRFSEWGRNRPLPQMCRRRRRAATTVAPPAPANMSTPASRPSPSCPAPLVLPSPAETAPVGACVTWLPEVVAVDDAGDAAHAVGLMMVFVSRVTAPLRASARPTTVAPVVRVMLCSAMTVPTSLELVPSVAELPTCQKTLQERAPLIRLTWLPDPVVSVEPAWKTQTAFGSLAASRVSGSRRRCGDWFRSRSARRLR